VVGPADLPHDLNGRSGNGVSPHWRRGHFRMQAFGVGKLERKLIFVAPVLIHAEQLQGEVPRPKTYRAGGATTDGWSPVRTSLEDTRGPACPKPGTPSTIPVG
jgi:hypothetical protein